MSLQALLHKPAVASSPTGIAKPEQKKFFTIQNNVLELSHSSVMSFRSCPRKLEFPKFHGVFSSDESLPAEVGKALHAGYQNFVSTKNKDAAIWAMMAAYPVHLCSNPKDPRSIEACLSTMEHLFNTQIFNSAEIAKIKTPDGQVKPAIEVPFLIKFPNLWLDAEKTIQIVYRGYIDMIIYDFFTGEYGVVDIKTTRTWSTDLTAKFQFDEQCFPYALVLERVLGKPIELLQVKYWSIYVDIAKPHDQIYPFSKSYDEVRDWARGLLIDIELMRSFYRMQFFPRHGNSCYTFNSPCRYFNVCQEREPADIKLFLKDEQPRPFEPWFTLEMELAA
jgi:hypothetical protein